MTNTTANDELRAYFRQCQEWCFRETSQLEPGSPRYRRIMSGLAEMVREDGELSATAGWIADGWADGVTPEQVCLEIFPPDEPS